MDRWVYELMNEWTNGQIDEENGWMNWQMDGHMDRWMDG